MDSLDAWLAAMPVKDVQERISVLERELEVLRTLARQHQQRAATVSTSRAAAPLRPFGGGQGVPGGPSGVKQKRVRKLSRERRAIIDLLRQNPDGMSPSEVTAGLQGDQNAIQTLLSRMAAADPPQVVRVEYGRYRLPSQDATVSLSNGSAGGETE